MFQEGKTFWLVENGHKQWFKKDKNFDKLIDHEFRGLINKSIKKKLIDWAQSTISSLALIIILD